MGWFGFGSSNEEDETLFQVSNDNGDHYVVSVPTSEADEVEGWFGRAKMKEDWDDEIPYQSREREYDKRDHDEHRWTSDRVVDDDADLEPDEDDDSIDERDEQAASGGWWRW